MGTTPQTELQLDQGLTAIMGGEQQNNSSIVSPETAPVSSNTGAPVTEQPPATQQNTAPNLEIDPFDWTKDKRYQDPNMWSQDPNRMYKSYKELETAHTQTSQERKQLLQKLETIKNEQAPYLELGDFFKQLQQHPRFGGEFSELVTKYVDQLNRDKYGEHTDPAIYEKLQELDNIKTKLKQDEEEKQITEQVKNIETQVDNISKFAEENGIVFDVEQQKKFLNYCKNNKIYGQHMYNAFVALSLDTIKKNTTFKAQNTVTENLNKIKQNGIPTGQESASPKPGSGNINSMSDLDSALASVMKI